MEQVKTRISRAGRTKVRFAWFRFRQTGEAGFSIFELLVVVTVLALGSYIVVAATTGTSQVELRAVTFDLANKIRQVRSAAILQGREKVLLIDLDRRLIQAEGEKRGYSLPSDIDLSMMYSAKRGEVPHLKFFPNGSSNGAEIRLSRNKRTARIDVNWLTGRVTVADPY